MNDAKEGFQSYRGELGNNSITAEGPPNALRGTPLRWAKAFLCECLSRGFRSIGGELISGGQLSDTFTLPSHSLILFLSSPMM